MADLSDVANTLASMIEGILYPNGTTQPSVIGAKAKIFVGWPVSTQLDADLACGLTNVSVYPTPMNRNTTRYMDYQQQASVNTPTIALAQAGQTVTLTGTVPDVSNPHNLAIYVNGTPYVIRFEMTDSFASAAARLAGLIAVDVSGTTSSGPVISMPATARIGPIRVGVTGTSVLEVARQEQVFQIGVWANTPETRDLFAKTIDGALKAIRRFALPDQASCRLIWKSSLQVDKYQKSNEYRRDLFYLTEFPTFATEIDTQITQPRIDIAVGLGGVDAYTDIVELAAGPGALPHILTEPNNDFLDTESYDRLTI